MLSRIDCLCLVAHCICFVSKKCCQFDPFKFEISSSGRETWLSCMVWLVEPSIVAEHQGVLAALGGGDSTNIPGTDPSCWDLICS